MREPNDRVVVELRAFERRQELAEAIGDRADEIAPDLANGAMCDSEKLRDVVNDYEVNIFDDLARCMQNIDRAADGDQISIMACLSALAAMQKLIRPQAMDSVKGEAQRQAQVEFESWAE